MLPTPGSVRRRRTPLLTGAGSCPWSSTVKCSWRDVVCDVGKVWWFNQHRLLEALGYGLSLLSANTTIQPLTLSGHLGRASVHAPRSLSLEQAGTFAASV